MVPIMPMVMAMMMLMMDAQSMNNMAMTRGVGSGRKINENRGQQQEHDKFFHKPGISFK
jgi:hypothetical protein